MNRFILSICYIIIFLSSSFAAQRYENPWTNHLDRLSIPDMEFIQTALQEAQVIQDFTLEQVANRGAAPTQKFHGLHPGLQEGAWQGVDFVRQIMAQSFRQPGSGIQEHIDSLSEDDHNGSTNPDSFDDLLEDVFSEYMDNDHNEQAIKQESKDDDFEVVKNQKDLDDESCKPNARSGRGRSSSSERYKNPSPTRLQDTPVEEGKVVIGEFVHNSYKSKNKLENGEISSKIVAQAIVAYGIDGLNYVSQGIDTVTFGAASWVGEKLDAAAEGVGTGLRRATRYVTGDQRLGQNVGDAAYLGLTVINPFNKACLPAQVSQKIASVNKLSKLSKTLDALSLETYGMTKSRQMSHRELDLGVAKLAVASRVRKINNRNPINAEYAGKVYPLEKLPEELRGKYPHSVPFTGMGHPDFSRYAIKKVEIQMTGSKADFAIADKAAGFSVRPYNHTWHHHHDGKSMYLVPTDIHEAVRHTGGNAIVKQNIGNVAK